MFELFFLRQIMNLRRYSQIYWRRMHAHGIYQVGSLVLEYEWSPGLIGNASGNCSAIAGLRRRSTAVAFGELSPRDAGAWQPRLLVAGSTTNRLNLLETSMLPVDTLVDECGEARIG